MSAGDPKTASTAPAGLPAPAAPPQGALAIARQVQLSWSKVFEISFNAVKVRFVRSLITAAGIVLAITFLMATFTRGVALEGLNRELPAKLEEQQRQIAQGERLQEQVRAAVQSGLPLGNVQGALRNSDPALAVRLLSDLEQKTPALGNQAEFRAIREGSSNLLAAHLELRRLNTLRLEMKRQGEDAGTELSEREEAGARNGWLVSLALLVAFVGIMNAMLMSVTERSREIGTMKCLGALDGFIVKLFLVESSMQGLLGTVLGVLLGLLMSLAKLTLDYGAGFLAWVPWADLGLRILVAICAGTFLAVAGAIYPAYLAARKEPVAALRVDQ